MYSDFVFLDRFLFELSCKNTHTHTNTDTQTHTDSNEYPIVAFSKNATIINISIKNSRSDIMEMKGIKAIIGAAKQMKLSIRSEMSRK